MKKIIILLSVAVAALAVSCNKVTPQDSTPDAPKGETITITVSLSDALTKVSLTQDSDPDGAIKVAWENTDKICVIDADNPASSSEFSIASIDSDKPYIATFTGTAVPASKYDILYGAESVAAAEAIDLSEQYQSGGNASLGHLKYMAILENVEISNFVTDPIEFSKSWAEEHGGVFKQNGVLRLRLQTPAGVSFVSSVSITPSQELFFKDNSRSAYTPSIKITFPENTAQQEHIITAYAMLPWGDAVDLPEGATLTIDIETDEQDIYSTTITPGAISFKPGQTNAIKLAASRFALQPFAGGNGTESNPYLIANATHMNNMHDVMEDGQTIFFKMIADVTLSGNWVSLNNSGSFSKGINFDGDNHTISNLTVGSSNAYPSLFGVLNGSAKNIIFENATITGGNNCAGVLAGYIGSASASVSGTCSGIIVNNSKVTGSKRGLGGLAGMVSKLSAPITNCSVNNTTVTSTADRVGGLAGQTEKLMSINNCSANNVTVKGTINIGGLIGVGYGNAMNCTSSGSISSTNTTSNADIGLGGLIGYFENGTVSKCSSSVNINQTTNGRDIGGLVGKMLAATIEKSFSTGNVKGIQRNVGGFVGLITNTSGESKITNCYCTGKVEANAYTGGFLGLHEKGNAVISNCYSTSEVSVSSFGAGGLVGIIGSKTFSMFCSIAWNTIVTAGAIGPDNWSSGAVVGVTFPTCQLTDNYRNPLMLLKAYWGTETGYTVQLASDYSHPNVSIENPLTDSTGDTMQDTATASGQPHYPIYPYNGKVDNSYTINQLAYDLNWSPDIWDFSGDFPTLK
ncbi:MAG: hypothetical protein J6X82_06825 [Bacteroidales bacterium]|nr:hypothetical protein [Bacteroidales bacterium]